jgi:hypothetical protein
VVCVQTPLTQRPPGRRWAPSRSRPNRHLVISGELLNDPDRQSDDRERDQDQYENFRDPGLAGRVVVTASHHHIIVVVRPTRRHVAAANVRDSAAPVAHYGRRGRCASGLGVCVRGQDFDIADGLTRSRRA